MNGVGDMSTKNICIHCKGPIDENYDPERWKPSARIVCENCTPITPKLSEPPSIELRIRAAMMDEYLYQVVTYSRREGATMVVMELAKRNKDIVIIGNDWVRQECKKWSLPFIHEKSDPNVEFRSKILIADAVNEGYLKGWISQTMKGNRLVVLKGIRTERDGEVYVQGRKIDFSDKKAEEAPYFDASKFNQHNARFVNRSE
jgi:hypothetical protein